MLNFHTYLYRAHEEMVDEQQKQDQDEGAWKHISLLESTNVQTADESAKQQKQQFWI